MQLLNTQRLAWMGVLPAYPLIERLTPMGWYNFTAWALNPLKTPRIPYLSALSILSTFRAQEWCAQVSLWVGTLLLVLYRLWCIWVLGMLSYGHKKRIFSFHLSVSLSLSYWCVSPILWYESFVGLVLRNRLFIWPLPTRRTFPYHFYECPTYSAYFVWVTHVYSYFFYAWLIPSYPFPSRST